jgi:uncharacterized protein (TIGR02145 family)
MNNRFTSVLIVMFALLLATCEKPERDNPWDEKNTLNPEAWAPQNLQAEDVTITEKKLTWSYDGDDRIEGFKLDRKKGDEPWQVGYEVFGKELRSWNDNDIIPDTNLNYQYRLYAFAGKNNSAQKNATTAVSFAPPADLTMTRNIITSVILAWQKNSAGEQGFKIERKYETGDWVEVATTTGTSWQDNDFELNTMVYYRVKAYYNEYTSAWLENLFDASIPPPENLTITANSATSVTLNWSYNLTGHEGFKIERQIDNGNWEMIVNNQNPNQTTLIDNGIDLQNQSYAYRIWAYLNQYPSQQIEFPEIPFLCGILNIIDSRDGNQYETVQIGNQCWMKENLKWLPNVSPSANGSNTSPYYYVYDYQGTSVSAAKATTNYQAYGVLYNWPAAIAACPYGWHLPADDEWTVLTDYLGGSSVAGGKMKTTGTTHWNSPNTGATNSSGFSGLPGGYHSMSGYFNNLGKNGGWWSSTEFSATPALYRYLYYDHANANRYSGNKQLGFSVRCVRD